MISPESVLLKEVVVTGASVINAMMRKIILPTASVKIDRQWSVFIAADEAQAEIQVDQMRNR